MSSVSCLLIARPQENIYQFYDPVAQQQRIIESCEPRVLMLYALSTQRSLFSAHGQQQLKAYGIDDFSDERVGAMHKLHMKYIKCCASLFDSRGNQNLNRLHMFMRRNLHNDVRDFHSQMLMRMPLFDDRQALQRLCKDLHESIDDSFLVTKKRMLKDEASQI